MITLYGFGKVFRPVIGETRDLRAQWALEEAGLPYRVHGLDHTGGEHETDAYAKLNCFRLVPVIEDDGVVVAESGAILLYIAEKSGKLLPSGVQERMAVLQWCFAALTTVERPMMEIQLIDKFSSQGQEDRRAEMAKAAHRWLTGLQSHLNGREWIACADFTIADILLASVLREIRKTDLLDAYPLVKAYYIRALARPAWQRTLELYADRLGVAVSDIA